jgi:hypothetical protein
MMGPHDDVQYFRGVEPQRRGALHDHVLLRCRGDVVAMREQVRALAIRHGFGHSLDLRWARQGDEGYVAKYVTDSVDGRANVEWLDVETGEVTTGARCRTWTSTRRWGATMRELRAQQRAWVRQRAAEQACGAGRQDGTAAGASVAAATWPGAALDHYTASYPAQSDDAAAVGGEQV